MPERVFHLVDSASWPRDGAPLAQDLRLETSREGASFPHLYRALEQGEVLRWWKLEARLGRWVLPVLGLVADDDEPQGTLGGP